MRLLSTRSWEMRDFLSDTEVPQYAILSHTWGEEEISFQQWETRDTTDISQLKGYQKIKKFGEQAGNAGFDWVWVDTYAYPLILSVPVWVYVWMTDSVLASQAAALIKRAALNSRKLSTPCFVGTRAPKSA